MTFLGFAQTRGDTVNRALVLRRVDHLHIVYESARHGQGWLVVEDGPDRFRVKAIQRREFARMMRSASKMPQWLAMRGRSACWMYKGSYFLDDLGLRQVEVRDLLDELRPFVRAAA